MNTFNSFSLGARVRIGHGLQATFSVSLINSKLCSCFSHEIEICGCISVYVISQILTYFYVKNTRARQFGEILSLLISYLCSGFVFSNENRQGSVVSNLISLN